MRCWRVLRLIRYVDDLFFFFFFFFSLLLGLDFLLDTVDMVEVESSFCLSKLIGFLC